MSMRISAARNLKLHVEQNNDPHEQACRNVDKYVDKCSKLWITRGRFPQLYQKKT